MTDRAICKVLKNSFLDSNFLNGQKLCLPFSYGVCMAHSAGGSVQDLFSNASKQNYNGILKILCLPEGANDISFYL